MRRRNRNRRRLGGRASLPSVELLRHEDAVTTAAECRPQQSDNVRAFWHKIDTRLRLDRALFWLKFKKACRRGNVKFFLQALEQFAGAADEWDIALQEIAELPQINSEIRHAFLNQWSRHKQLSYRAHQDPVVER
ncbi:MAG TPA: hypothetical protein VKP66_19775 [Steroidobacteraceae bacterium]|nr:hypothetical protein [Steroidobacteraceae bacterium]